MTAHSPIAAVLRAITAPRLHVYPGYLAFRIKRALKVDDGESIVATVGDIETVGDCRYVVPVTDHNGMAYRITVEVMPAKETTPCQAAA